MAFRFLVVDDSVRIQALYRSALHMGWPGAEVVAVASENEAIREATGDRWDLILMDAQLSPGSGISAILQIRAAGVSVPILFVSGDDESVLCAARDAGATDVRHKPVPVSELIALANRLVNAS
ncbi:response regulator [Candidatus Parcubacteria bacterium]|nr:response regulator [Candidatus Parcubacteria bacterium]